MTVKFTRKLANDIASTSVSYVLESTLDSDADASRYSLNAEGHMFRDNFIESLEEQGLIITEYRVDIISACFEKQLQVIRRKVNKIYNKHKVKYEQ